MFAHEIKRTMRNIGSYSFGAPGFPIEAAADVGNQRSYDGD